MKKSTIKRIRESIPTQFPGYSLSNEQAPRGQNDFCCNFLLVNEKGRKFLLKVIEGKSQDDISDEVNANANIRSPYVLAPADIKVQGNIALFLFPYLEGKSLRDYMKEKGNFREDEIRQIAVDVLRGIQDIYRHHETVHQDIKPENIFVPEDGNIKLLDFGMTRYKPLLYRGRGKWNFRYSSPEQIEASPPSSVERSRAFISDKSDVFSFGLILYEMITGSHPYSDNVPDAILNGEPIPVINGDVVSEGLKRVVMRMLEFNSGRRSNAQETLSYLERGDIDPVKVDQRGFFYCVTGKQNVKRFVNFSRQNNDLFDGVIIEAAGVTKENRVLQEMRMSAGTVIVDPQTYFFQRFEAKKVKLKKVPYINFASTAGDRRSFKQSVDSSDASVDQFIQDVFGFEEAAGANFLVPPFFYIEDFNDEYWSIDQALTRRAVEIHKEQKRYQPLVKGVALSSGLLRNERSRKKILEYLMGQYEFSGFLVLIETPQGEVISDQEWLESAEDFFTDLLVNGKFAIWSRADISGLTLARIGLSVAVGEFKTQRSFDLNDSSPGWGDRRVRYFYLSSMFARAKWPSGLQALMQYGQYDSLVVCSDQCCEGRDFRNLGSLTEHDVGCHLLHSLRRQWNQYVGRDGLSKLREDIEQARSHYHQIKQSGNVILQQALTKDVKPATQSFLESWLNSFHGD